MHIECASWIWLGYGRDIIRICVSDAHLLSLRPKAQEALLLLIAGVWLHGWVTLKCWQRVVGTPSRGGCCLLARIGLDLAELPAHVELHADVVHAEHVRADSHPLEALACEALLLHRVPLALKHLVPLSWVMHNVHALAQGKQLLEGWHTRRPPPPQCSLKLGDEGIGDLLGTEAVVLLQHIVVDDVIGVSRCADVGGLTPASAGLQTSRLPR